MFVHVCMCVTNERISSDVCLNNVYIREKVPVVSFRLKHCRNNCSDLTLGVEKKET